MDKPLDKFSYTTLIWIYMATPVPYPIPTPPQSVEKGGNPYLKPGTYGPALSNTAVPISNLNGTTTFSSGVQYPSSSTNIQQSFAAPSNNTNNSSAQTNWATQQSIGNPYTTYTTINNETKKNADWISEGKMNPDGSLKGSGGGGGQPSTYTSPEGQTFGSLDEYNNLINEVFGSTMGYLNQNEGLLGNAKSAAEKQIEAENAANMGLLGRQKDSAIGTIESQQEAGQKRKEDSFAKARRLYAELQMANRQRFGGATSAGQAASEIQGAEAQRQFGQTNRDFNDFIATIEGAKRDVEEQFNQGVLQLKQGVQTALAKVQSDFTNAIMQINNLRAQTEQQKGQAKLQALYNLRSQAAAIQQQEKTFEQQLIAMREQQRLNIETYAKTAGTAGTAASNTYTQFGTSITPQQYSQVNSGVQSMPQNLQGYIKKPEEWNYVGQIGKAVVGQLPDGRNLYSDGTAGWSKY